MTILATILLYVWPLLCMAIVLRFRLPLAVGLIAMLAHAVMPQVSYGLLGSLNLTPISVGGVAVVGACFVTGNTSPIRFSVLDIGALTWCLLPIASGVTNGIGMGIAPAVSNLLNTGAYYLAGRLACRNVTAVKDMLLALVIGGIVYMPLCWYEMRMSPQLSHQLYGYSIQNFNESIRLGGWRPIVFMEHGIMTAFWMGLAFLAAVGLWLDDRVDHRRFSWQFAGLLSMYDQGDQPKRIRVGVDPLPVGAGMTGRREIFRFVFDELGSVAVGRKGQSLAGGEDCEAMYVAHRLGREIWYSPALRAEHFVPCRKLTEAYRDKWMIDTASCHAWLEVLSNRESRSHWCWWRRRLQFSRLAFKYALLGLLPGLRCTWGKSARFWRQFYQSKAAGWGRLLRDRDAIMRVLRKVDEQTMPIAGAVTTPLAGTT